MSDNGLRNILFPVYSLLAGLPRPVSLGLMFVISLFWIAFLTLFLSKDSEAAKLLLDYSSDSLFPYPFTIQNLMYVFFLV